MGEYDHAKLQTALAAWFFNRRKLWGIHPLTEQRVQVSPSRFRVPDVCVVAGPEPREAILTQPPLLCIEILSREDRVLNMQEKVQDYLAFGVRFVWVMNPQTLATTVYTRQGTYEVKDGILKTENPEIVLPLAELFA